MTVTSLSASHNERLDGADRATVRTRYDLVRSATLDLVRPLSTEDQQIQSMPDASPTKWHLAHTTWFFETFLLAPAGEPPFDERYGYLFNSYYESVGARHPRPERGLVTRPRLDEVMAYREHVDRAMRRLILDLPEAYWTAARERLELGLQHEQQHQELILMDIKHALFANPLQPAYAPAAVPARSPGRATDWLEFDGGLVELGAEGDSFAFDNERPRHKTWLEPFRLQDRLVTAGEWAEFIADDGYRRPEFWLSDGWATVQREGWAAPLYWSDDGRQIFTLHGPRLCDPEAPVCHVSYYEADAFARWRGVRLPTEAEWEFATAASQWPDSGFALHPRPAGDGAGLRQMAGEVWQWTASPYVPYPRFRPAPGALGEYNGKFMSGQMVLRGGACVTPPGHARPTYRNFFPPAARWPFTGVRLADDA